MRRFWVVDIVRVIVVGLFIGCSTEDPDPIYIDDDPESDDQTPVPYDRNPEPGEKEFISSNPWGWWEHDWTFSDADGDGDGDSDGDGDGDGDGDADGDADRAIEEADIIKVVGDTLYALSEYRGLVVIDISDPVRLSVLGRQTTYGRPFEMYVRDDIAYALYSSFWSYQFDEETSTGEWVTTSRVMAFDVSNPESIQVQGIYDLVGQISDSRIIGDVLYAVAFENGWCWRCEGSEQTTITSINIADPDNIYLLQRLSYESDGHWYQRSISVTPERMYVSGHDYDSQSSTIQVVDISDPQGRLHAGAEVEIAGQIESRWQMDEHEGVLRVVSQPWNWGAAPIVETFAVESADDIAPLGRLEMDLPRPEDLMSVRFDGDRGYAVTFEQTDPLFVLDLSDPENPRQRGELEIPGWLYHMEPRGDRLFAIGYDPTGDTSLAVSLFDVSDMDAPRLIERVNFGSGWSRIVEDQDRIHKAFRILDDLEMIVMPFAGWSYDHDDPTESYFQSGIQLIDFTADDLRIRGVAPHRGVARRAFVHRDQLFAMSNERVEAFDISDRDEPQRTSGVILARTVYRAIPVGDHVAELVSDWWSGEARLDLLPLDDPDGMTATGSVDLSVLRTSTSSRHSFWNYHFSYSDSRLFAHDNHVYLLWYENDCSAYDPCRVTGVAVIDVSDATTPTLVAVERMPFTFPYQGDWWWNSAVTVGDSIVQIGSTLVLYNGGTRYHWDEDGAPALEILDLSDPTAPVHAATFELPGGGVTSRIQVVDGAVITSHSAPVDPDEMRVRFYLDTIDVSDPTAPRLESSVNIPGSPIWQGPDTGRLVTVDYQRVSFPIENGHSCYDSPYTNVVHDRDDDRCYALERTLNLLDVEAGEATLIDRLHFEGREIHDVRVTPTRLFVGTDPYYDVDDDPRPELITLTGVDTGAFEERSSVRMNVPFNRLFAGRDERAFILSDWPPTLDVLDTSDADDPVWAQQNLLTGYSYDVRVFEDMVISANGVWGVQVIDL